MIKSYLAAIPSLYEGEDIEIRYTIFQDDVLIKKEADYLGYEKPAVTGLISVLTLLRKLEKYKAQEIIIFINDSSLYELLIGRSTVKNGDVIKMAGKVKKQLEKFENLTFDNVYKNKAAMDVWKENT